MKPNRPTHATGRCRSNVPLRPIRSSRKDLIRLNTGALRKKALLAHRKAERSLSLLKDQLKRFHEKDVPGFRSWVHRTFGHIMSQQRELQRTFEEKRAFVYEIQAMADRYHLSELAAYRKVLWRRAHPDEAQEEDRLFEEAERKRQEARPKGGPSGFPDLDDLLGDFDLNEEPDDDWDDMGDFFETLGGKHPTPRETHHSNQKSIKELYRKIVRLLHPDRHGQMTDARKALWHEAQQAYRRHDLNALQSVLARCDGGEALLGDHSPISLIQRMTQQLKAAAQATKREMRSLRREVAWDYETRIRNPAFVRNVKADLQGMVDSLQWSLDEIQRELDRLDRMASRQAKRPRFNDRFPG